MTESLVAEDGGTGLGDWNLARRRLDRRRLKPSMISYFVINVHNIVRPPAC